jgi:hypothetical protein
MDQNMVHSGRRRGTVRRRTPVAHAKHHALTPPFASPYGSIEAHCHCSQDTSSTIY